MSEIIHATQAASAQTTKYNESAAASWRPKDADGRRRYHKAHDSGYMLPSDEAEQSRLELQHKILRLAFGNDVICPEAQSLIKSKSSKILDVGCANGAWLDTLFVDHKAQCEFNGADLAEDAFKLGTKSHAKIVCANVLEGLPYSDSTFDYVHQRLLVLGVPKDKWANVIKELARVTKPGGWVEVVEVNMFKNGSNGPDTKAIVEPAFSGFEKRGLDPNAGTNLQGYVAAAGNLTNIQVKSVKVPIGWDGELGRLAAEDMTQAFDSMADWMMKALGLTSEEYREKVDKMYQEMPKQKAYLEFFAVWGQKVDCALPPSRATQAALE